LRSPPTMSSSIWDCSPRSSFFSLLRHGFPVYGHPLERIGVCPSTERSSLRPPSTVSFWNKEGTRTVVFGAIPDLPISLLRKQTKKRSSRRKCIFVDALFGITPLPWFGEFSSSGTICFWVWIRVRVPCATRRLPMFSFLPD